MMLKPRDFSTVHGDVEALPAVDGPYANGPQVNVGVGYDGESTPLSPAEARELAAALTAAADWAEGSPSWTTTEPWPKTLPGTPA